MRWLSSIYLSLTIIGYACAQFSNLLPGGRRSSEDFDCVQEFGYYPHPTDCSRYYVCVFGGALEETCSSGLVYSTELQTCDWPRNVASCSARTGRSRPDSRRSGSLTSGHRPQSPHSSRNVNSRLLEPREPVRNSLNNRQRTTVSIADASAPFSVSERFRLLDHIDNREPQPFDFDASTGADGNKIVARRQQRLLSLEDDRSRDNFQHSSRIIGDTDSKQVPDVTDYLTDSVTDGGGVKVRRARSTFHDDSELHAHLTHTKEPNDSGGLHPLTSDASSVRHPRRALFIPPPLRGGKNPFQLLKEAVVGGGDRNGLTVSQIVMDTVRSVYNGGSIPNPSKTRHRLVLPSPTRSAGNKHPPDKIAVYSKNSNGHDVVKIPPVGHHLSSPEPHEKMSGYTRKSTEYAHSTIGNVPTKNEAYSSSFLRPPPVPSSSSLGEPEPPASVTTYHPQPSRHSSTKHKDFVALNHDKNHLPFFSSTSKTIDSERDSLDLMSSEYIRTFNGNFPSFDAIYKSQILDSTSGKYSMLTNNDNSHSDKYSRRKYPTKTSVFLADSNIFPTGSKESISIQGKNTAIRDYQINHAARAKLAEEGNVLNSPDRSDSPRDGVLTTPNIRAEDAYDEAQLARRPARLSHKKNVYRSKINAPERGQGNQDKNTSSRSRVSQIPNSSVRTNNSRLSSGNRRRIPSATSTAAGFSHNSASGRNRYNAKGRSKQQLTFPSYQQSQKPRQTVKYAESSRRSSLKESSRSKTTRLRITNNKTITSDDLANDIPFVPKEHGVLPPSYNVPSYISKYSVEGSAPKRSSVNRLPLEAHAPAPAAQSRTHLTNKRRRPFIRTKHRISPGNKLQLKPTEAPVRISTISSFSFGDTGTRSPVHITTPAPAISRPLTSPRPVSSSSNRQHSLRTRFPPRLTQSTFVSPPRSFGAGRSSLGRKTTPANVVPTRPPVTFSGSSRRPAVSGVTEPAYVAYFNDTIYDVYYIYDDDDVQYDELDYGDTVVTSVAPFLSSIATTPSTTTTKTTRRTTPTTTATTRRPERVTNIHTVFNQPKSTPSRRRIPLFSLDHIRQEVTGRKNANYKRPTESKFNARKPQKNLPNKFGGSAGEAGGAGRRGSTTLGSSSSFGPPSRPLPSASFSTLSGGRTSSRSRHNSRSKHKQSASGSSSLGSARQVANTGLKSIRISGRHPSSSSSSRSSKRQNALAKSSSSKANVWDSLPQRPVPLYPQPIPDQPAERCDARCRLPDCNCGGKTNPGGLLVEQTPQLVVLTFDDSVNDLNHELYQDMFENNRLNPNGCPIAATFYVSHEWTNYKQVQNLYADGHEIASHSISHSFGEQFSTSKWEAEIAGQREILAAYGGVRMEDVRGMRAPFLSIGGNRMFKMLYNNNFTYDSSMPVYENNPPSWPYTMDYKVHHDCMIPPCPNKAYPGVWEVPMVMWQDLNGGRCSMVDACTAPSTDEGVYNMLIKNFQRHYTTNRAVFPLYFHAAWMTTKHHREGFMAFLDTISKMDDVWLVTNWQAIQWMRDPQPLSTIKQFQPFGCHYPERPPRCSKAKKCNLWHKSGVRYMTTCQPCPKKYPWTGRTGVAKP